MDSNTFMGLFIGAVLALLAGVGIIAKIAIKPMLDLGNKITTLQDSIDNLRDKDTEIKADYRELKDEVRDTNEKVNKMDQRLLQIETKLEIPKKN